MTFFVQFTEGVSGRPSNRFYRKNKANGSYRIIGAPNEPMAEVQKRLASFLEKHSPQLHSSAAKKRGLGSVRNGRVHAGRSYRLVLDFSYAFASTDTQKLSALIAEQVQRRMPTDAPTSEEWHAFLSEHVYRRKGGLVEGAKTSQFLLDWYCEVYLDRPMRHLLRKWEGTWEGENTVRYTRYVDDLTFSSHWRITRPLKKAVRKIIAAAGFKENYRKTQVGQPSDTATVRITGTRVGGERGFGLGRKEVKQLERLLDTALHMPLFVSQDAEEVEGKLRYLLDVVRGKAALNALEARTIEMYRQWCVQNGRDASWPTKVLERKWKGKKGKRQTAHAPK